MSIKGKLLEAVGEVDVSDIGTEALVDILTSRIKAQDKKIQELHGENARERQRLHDETEAMRRDRKEMQRNPLACAHGEYFFRCERGLIIINVQGYKMTVMERVGKANIDYLLEQVPPSEYYGAAK